MLDENISVFDKDALLYRLHEGLEDTNKDVVFVVGAPVTAPFDSKHGVADVNAVVELIRSEFITKPAQLEKLDSSLSSSNNAYQSAFDFLSGRVGQNAANKIIKRAVSQALIPSSSADWGATISNLSENQLQDLDRDNDAWHLSPAAASLGDLIANHPDRFGKIIITSNFDPLLEVAIRRNGGAAWYTSLSSDGSIFQSTALGCHVIHIHGYWHGTDTLHTHRQLVQQRPTLKNDLLTLLENKIVVVMAYGGWPDIFTGALGGIVTNDNLFPEILWTFFDENPNLSDYLYNTLKPGIDKNRITFYKGINCHEFLPELLSLWDKTSHSGVLGDTDPSTSAPQPLNRAKLFRLPPLECDRPPNIDVWVGRESELRSLETSKAKIVIICGMGGEGKSALASHYIHTLQEREGRYRFWDWRDCKEQSDRIRTQVVEIIVRFSRGTILADDLAEANDLELVELLIDYTQDAHAILVFDNVDSYVDLENGKFTGMLDAIVQKMATSESTSRIVITCRPDVQYAVASAITFSIKGLSEDEAIELFAMRAPHEEIPEIDIREAHSLTKGHAFWLDLLAVQVSNVPGTTLRKMLDDLRRGREEVPDVLSSIWDKLALREKTLLRFMAEAVRPETEKTIERFVASQVNYKNFSRALKSLISLNLIVVKPENSAPDLYDLHPLVRQFVRTKFAQAERNSIITVVINQYKAIIGTIGSLLGINLPLVMLERWSQKAELEVSAEMYEEAFATLKEVEDALVGGGHVQEYVRVGRLLFEAIDWETAATKYKEFDHVVGVMVAAFNQLADTHSADDLLAQYERTIPQKTARYIKYCDVKAYSHWMRGNFDDAIEWASKGVSLKNETNVDTDFDCKHTLALAQRDAGQPAVALEQFSKGYQLQQILAGGDELSLDGPLFGNVGRCLQMLGNTLDALTCYRKSMNILESDSSSHSKSNRAYARRWVGQVFAELGDTNKAEAFYVDAIRILGTSAPIRVRELCSDLEGVRSPSSPLMGEVRATQIVNEWRKALH